MWLVKPDARSLIQNYPRLQDSDREGVAHVRPQV